MRAVVQRVTSASVHVNDEIIGEISRGLVVLVGVARDDQHADACWLADKIVTMRVFENAQGNFDASVGDIGGAVLVVSQFTLYADTRKGRRPSFTAAADPERAQALYQEVVQRIAAHQIPVQTGRFGARMQVHLVNDGPVTFILEAPGDGGAASPT